MNSSASFRVGAMKLAGIAVFLAVLVSPVWAQSTGSLVGTVKDESGLLVPDATVSLYRQGMTEPAVQTRTNGQGFFELRSLQPESYRIGIEKQGFAPYEPPNMVTLAPGTETPLNGIVLTVGAQAAGTTVVEPHVSVQTSDAEVSANLTTAQLDTLPILDRKPLDLVLTQAGVVSGAAFTTIDGLRTSLSNVTLDGINIQDNSLRYNGLNFVANNLVLGQVSQFTLVTSNQAANYGNGITQTAFVTPSGTNELHGSAFYLNSNNPMNANSWSQNQLDLKDEYKSNQAGFAVGGPLVKNKLFGYVGYEFLRSPDTIGTKAYTLAASFLPSLAAAGFTVNPVVSGLLSQLPNTNLQPYLPLDQYNGTNERLPLGVYEHAESSQTDWDNAIARLDYTPSKASTLVFSYLWNRDNADGTPSLYGSRYAEVQHEKANLLSGSWRYMPNPHFTNEVRAGVDIYQVAFINREATAPYTLNLGPLQKLLNPVSSYPPSGRTVKTYDIQDNASYLVRGHDIQFGFQAQFIRDSGYLQGNSLDSGSSLPVVYLGDGTGAYSVPDVAAVLSGEAYQISQQFYPVNSSGAFGAVPQQNYLGLNNYSAYVQDTWKITSRLLLTAGLRYEHYSTLRDSRGLFYTPQLVNGNLAATFSAGTPIYNPQGGGFYSAMNNAGPSIGLAFDPSGSGRTVFRAAYGIGYVNDDFVEALRRTLDTNEYWLGGFGGFVLPSNINDTISTSFFQNLGSVVSSLIPAPPGGSGVPSPGGGALGLIDPKLRAPYVQQWSAGVQHEMRGFVLDLRYVGNHAVRLLRFDEMYAANDAGYANAVYYMSNSSASTYNALQFDVSRRLRRDLQFQANYTFAKALTDSNTFGSSIIDPYRDPSNQSLDKGPAVFDVRNAFKINLTYDLPFGRGRMSSMPLHALFGGWSVSASAVAQSGEPFSILTGNCDPGCQTATSLLSGSALSSAVSYHMTGNGPSIITSSAVAAGDFVATPTGPGFLAPRSFYGPGTFDLNLGLQKRFHITEQQSLELRGVAINALNHPSFGFNNQCLSVSSACNDSSFGQNAYTVYPARTMQLSAYYHF